VWGRSGCGLSVDLLRLGDHRRLPPVVCFVLIPKPAQTLPWPRLQTKKLEPAPLICFRVGGSFSQNPEITFLLGPGGMHVENHAASAPRCRGAGDQRCVEMIT